MIPEFFFGGGFRNADPSSQKRCGSSKRTVASADEDATQVSHAI